MNKTLTPMLVLVLASCVSSGTKEATVQDSTAVNDTLPVSIPEEHAAPPLAG